MRRLALLALLLLSACSGGPRGGFYRATETPIDRARPVRINALGDSHTTSGRYLAEVHRRLAAGGTHIGLIGQGAKTIAGRLPDILADRPTHVIVQAGVNDLASGRSVKHTREWLAAMYRQVRAADARVIAIPILPWADYLDRPRFRAQKSTLLRRTRALNAWIAEQHAAGVIDAVVAIDDLGTRAGALRLGYALKDGLHLSGRGQQVLGQRVADAILASGTIDPRALGRAREAPSESGTPR